MKMYNPKRELEMFGIYDTKTFTEVFNSPEVFAEEYRATSLFNDKLDLDVIYALLYAEHGNDPISQYSVD